MENTVSAMARVQALTGSNCYPLSVIEHNPIVGLVVVLRRLWRLVAGDPQARSVVDATSPRRQRCPSGPEGHQRHISSGKPTALAQTSSHLAMG